MGIQGSDEAYKNLIRGTFEKYMGLRVIPVPYLENKYVVSVKETVVDDKIV
jgi:hypothetical protein